jgi:hypothetical protein
VGEPVLRMNDAEQNYSNVIADNDIHDLGLIYAPAVGIWALQSGQNQIIHNHVHDLCYTAISVGWAWGYGPNQSNGNLIAFNHLHEIGKNMLSDMGGIYTLGEQPGTVIQLNLIHDISSFTYGGWGIYMDDGDGKGLFVAGVKLSLALADLGLIDEYEFVVHPRLAGHGPTLFAGLSKPVDLRLVSRARVRLGGGGDAV